MNLATGFADILKEKHEGNMSREEASDLFAVLVEAESLHLIVDQYRTERMYRPRLNVVTA